ncbi:MAG: redoxin domain-containing protein [Acidobacteriaceae bacterium]
MRPRRLEIALIVAVGLLSAVTALGQSALDLNGVATSPFTPTGITVLIFVRTDCPISNRYAPEIQRLAREFQGSAKFWLVYPDQKETPAAIRKHLSDYRYTLSALRDTRHELVREAQAQITPEAAVFVGKVLRYVGRIDDRAVDFGTFRVTATTHDLESALGAVIERRPVEKASKQAVGCYISDLE